MEVWDEQFKILLPVTLREMWGGEGVTDQGAIDAAAYFADLATAARTKRADALNAAWDARDLERKSAALQGPREAIVSVLVRCTVPMTKPELFAAAKAAGCRAVEHDIAKALGEMVVLDKVSVAFDEHGACRFDYEIPF